METLFVKNGSSSTRSDLSQTDLLEMRSTSQSQQTTTSSSGLGGGLSRSQGGLGSETGALGGSGGGPGR